MMQANRCLVETDLSVLHTVSDEVDLNDLSMTRRIDIALSDMFDSLQGKAQGISAIQCGINKRAALLRYDKGKPAVIIYNPKVLFKFGVRKSNEGCLSEGNIRYFVKRPLLVYVEYYTRHKELKREWLTYRRARIFMHEFDHMNGVLLQDVGKRVYD